MAEMKIISLDWYERCRLDEMYAKYPGDSEKGEMLKYSNIIESLLDIEHLDTNARRNPLTFCFELIRLNAKSNCILRWIRNFVVYQMCTYVNSNQKKVGKLHTCFIEHCSLSTGPNQTGSGHHRSVWKHRAFNDPHSEWQV